ncbi:MAG: N-(5'-phosphoribosyl)anthranilate isomerase [Geobacteraceae bacterium GWC2_48_7]|nr:MAG: N-(5'-phosphoribosyl)anthranilate isomerase [Geobacteraceae bacterium GWC2_48_7]
MARVKICGITNLEDAMVAVDAGADALGFVFHPPSPRNISSDQAAGIIAQLPPFIQCVGLFVDQTAEKVNQTVTHCRLDLVQLHGDESPDYCKLVKSRIIKAIRVKNKISLEDMRSYQVSAFLLDAWSPLAHGGTGLSFDWELAIAASGKGRIILAGGLTPENVADAVRLVNPYAVDVSSGVEVSAGKKDPEKILEFVKRAKGITS